MHSFQMLFVIICIITALAIWLQAGSFKELARIRMYHTEWSLRYKLLQGVLFIIGFASSALAIILMLMLLALCEVETFGFAVMYAVFFFCGVRRALFKEYSTGSANSETLRSRRIRSW